MQLKVIRRIVRVNTVLTSQAMRGRVTVDGYMVPTTVMPDRHCHTVGCSTTTVLLLCTTSRTATAIAMIVLSLMPIEVLVVKKVLRIAWLATPGPSLTGQRCLLSEITALYDGENPIIRFFIIINTLDYKLRIYYLQKPDRINPHPNRVKLTASS
jgi:hypothetical protein